MARITKTQKYAILWLQSQNLTIEDIQKELKLDSKQIISVIKNTIIKSTTEHTVQENKITSKDLMIRNSQSGTRNVAIMTKAASEMNDENKKLNYSNNRVKPSTHIYRPHGS